MGRVGVAGTALWASCLVGVGTVLSAESFDALLVADGLSRVLHESPSSKYSTG